MSRGKKGLLAGLALFGLSAVLAWGTSAAALTVSSGTAAGEDDLAPAPVASVSVEGDEEGPSVLVTWEVSGDDFVRQTAVGMDLTSNGVFANVNDVAGYEIWRSSGGEEAELIGEVPAGETSFVDENVELGETYVYSVVAVDAAGNQSASVESGEVLLRAPGKELKLTLDVAPEQAEEVLADEETKIQLEQDLIAVLAEMLGIDPARIVITNLGVGSLIVEFVILEDEEDPEAPSAEEVAATLEQQIEEDPATFASTVEESTVLEDVGTEISVVEKIEGAKIAFGEVEEDGVAVEELSFLNEGEETQTLSISVEGEGFGVSEVELVLGPGEEGLVEVSFSAADVGNEPGDYAGLLVVESDVPAEETTHELTATVVPPPPEPPMIDLSGTAFNFALVKIGETSTKVLTITNKGDLLLEGALEIEGDEVFTVSDTGFALAGGESLEIEVTFAPADTVEYSATLLVTSNDSENPELGVELSGVGVEEVVLALPGDFDGDKDVDFDDFFLFADQFGTTPDSANWDPVYSLDGDDDVDFDDFFIFADNFGRKVE